MSIILGYVDLNFDECVSSTKNLFAFCCSNVQICSPVVDPHWGGGGRPVPAMNAANITSKSMEQNKGGGGQYIVAQINNGVNLEGVKINDFITKTQTSEHYKILLVVHR